MSRHIVINKIKKFTLFSHICLKKSVCFASCPVSKANTGDNYCVDGGLLTLPYGLTKSKIVYINIDYVN